MFEFLFFVFIIVFLICKSIANRKRRKNYMILNNWTSLLPAFNFIKLTGAGIEKKKDTVHLSGSYNSFNKQLPEEVKNVQGKSTARNKYVLNVTNITNTTFAQVAFYCSEYDKFGRVDSNGYLCYTIEDLRPNETKQVTIAHYNGILFLEEIETFSTRFQVIDSIFVRKPFPNK